ncbi:MAG: hypothetical protein AAF639_25215 [Chloroflexota bacterium]
MENILTKFIKNIRDNLIKQKPKPPFDDTSKFFYRDFFLKLQLEADTETNVFDKARAIDLVVICHPKDHPTLENTIFHHFETVNDMEFKGDNDPLTLDNYYLIIARAYALAYHKEKQRIEEDKGKKADAKKAGTKKSGAKQEKPRRFLPRDMTLTIICVTRPDTILDELEDELGFEETTESGIYYNAQQIDQWIIHPSELEVVPKNYPLLPLSRGKTLEAFMEVCLREGLHEYLELILSLRLYKDPSTVLEKILEVTEMNEYMPWSEKTQAVVDRFFTVFPEYKERVIATTLEQGIEQGFEKGVEIGREEGHEKGLEKGKILAKQETLLDLIKYKFSDIPTIVLTMIEDNEDMDLLSRWMNVVLDTNDIEAIIMVWKDTLLSPN